MATLVTGIAGNLGSALSARLAGNVIGIGRQAAGPLESLMSLAGQCGVKCVVHTGFDLRTNAGDFPELYLDANIMATARLLEASARNGVKVFFYASSSSVLQNVAPVTQDGSAQSQGVYGAIKACNEALIRNFCERHGMRWVCCRIFNIFGGTDRHSIIARLDEAVATGRVFQLNNGGRDSRDFIHVDDVAEVIVALLEDPNAVGFIEIGNGTPVKTQQVVDWYREWFPGLNVLVNQGGFPTHSCADFSVTRRILGDRRIILQSWLESRFAAQELRIGA